MNREKKTRTHSLTSPRTGKPGKGESVPEKPQVPMFDAGVTTKDSAYRDRIMRAVASDREHPIHHGVKMQAHHLISTTAMKLSDLGPKLRKFGYDINELQNLVLLPCTLQGACHLGVQPHRGNHTAALEDQPYKDDDHPRRYHIMVKDKLLDLQMGLQKDCPGYLGGPKVVEARLKVKRQLDDLSSEILVDVQRNPRRAPLTKVALSFQPGNPAGCCGVDSTATHIGLHDCPVKRNHQQAQGPNQRDEKITYRSMERHILKVGA